jgi:hypothetical protein
VNKEQSSRYSKLIRIYEDLNVMKSGELNIEYSKHISLYRKAVVAELIKCQEVKDKNVA